jgi:hypothetical protein
MTVPSSKPRHWLASNLFGSNLSTGCSSQIERVCSLEVSAASEIITVSGPSRRSMGNPSEAAATKSRNPELGTTARPSFKPALPRTQTSYRAATELANRAPVKDCYFQLRRHRLARLGNNPSADRSDLLETRKALWSICSCAERALATGLLGLQSFQASFQRAALLVRPAIARQYPA